MLLRTVAWLGLTSCTALAHVDISYRDCVPPPSNHYEESFDGSYQDMVDRCWQADSAPPGTKLFTGEGDFILRPVRGLRWSASSQATAVYRKMKGDFLVVTRAEATSTFNGDHCLFNEESAGLFARQAQPLAVATLTVRPFFDPAAKVDKLTACKDNGPSAPTATADASVFGFGGAPPSTPANAIGADAEALIGMCRQGDQLAFYYGVETADPRRPRWLPFAQHKTTAGPLDVGLTASGANVVGPDPGIEAHFTFVVFDDYSERPIADGCGGAFGALVLPDEG